MDRGVWQAIVHGGYKWVGHELGTKQQQQHHVIMSGAMLGITDKMEAWPQTPLLIPQARSGMKELALVILACFFLSLVELAGKNVKVLIVLERSMRRHKAFNSCAQRIIHKVNIDICSRIFTKNVPGWASRPQLEAMGRIVNLRPVCEGNIYGKRSLLSLGYRSK